MLFSSSSIATRTTRSVGITLLSRVFTTLCSVGYDMLKYLGACYLQPLAKELGIKVVPTFKILKDGKVVKEVTGAKIDELAHAIETVKSS
jgi:hypothetical protein